MTAKLVYSALSSLDGYIEDPDGNFDWAMPDAEVHQFINDLQRPVGTYLFGRRMYEVMKVWQDLGGPTDPPIQRDFAELWRAADKRIYSTTLTTAGVTTPRTTLSPSFDTAELRALKASATRDLAIGGPTLATHALRAGLVDELHFFLAPILVGGGKPSLPDGVTSKLELLDARRFEKSGFVHLHYRVV
jgi:dihydrofolate reductase